MLLSVQQKYILEILRRTGCIRRRQLFPLVREKFRPWAWKFPSTAWR